MQEFIACNIKMLNQKVNSPFHLYHLLLTMLSFGRLKFSIFNTYIKIIANILILCKYILRLNCVKYVQNFCIVCHYRMFTILGVILLFSKTCLHRTQISPIDFDWRPKGIITCEHNHLFFRNSKKPSFFTHFSAPYLLNRPRIANFELWKPS